MKKRRTGHSHQKLQVDSDGRWWSSAFGRAFTRAFARHSKRMVPARSACVTHLQAHREDLASTWLWHAALVRIRDLFERDKGLVRAGHGGHYR